MSDSLLRRGSLWRLTALGAAILMLTGCAGSRLSGTGGRLEAETIASVAPNGVSARLVIPDFETALYRAEKGGDTSAFLADVSLDDLLAGRVERGHLLHVELLWEPKAGATPMDDSATNVSVHYVIVVNGELGVYSGAGFAQPSGRPGDDTFGLTIRDSTMRLIESTPGYVDQLGAFRLTGGLTMQRRDDDAARVQRTISQIVTNALGKPMWI